MGEISRRLAILVIIVLWSCVQSRASDSQLTAPLPTTKEIPISLSATLRGSSNLIARGTPGHESSTDIEMNLSLPVGDWAQFSALQGLSKAYQDEETLDLTNTRLGLRHNRIKIHRDVDVRNGILARLPTNNKTREQDRLRGSAGIDNLIDIRLGQGPILLSNRLILRKNFHEFTVSRTGSPNVEWSLIEGLTTEAELGKVVSLSLDLEYTSSRTYGGTSKSKLAIAEEIRFQATKEVAISLGHSNEGDLVSSTQKSSNIETFDEANSTVYGEINVTF